MKTKIEFKGKIEKLYTIEGNIACERIKIPKLDRKHCNMSEFRAQTKYGAFANSDLFHGVLSRIKKQVFGETEYLRLNAIPESVKINTNNFLAVVTFEV